MSKLNKSPLEFCPECNSANLQNEETLFDEGEVSIKVRCENCNEAWWEVYVFSFTDLEH